jgi:[amino group carrier protein]-L-2-aminoadipate 6-kinase
MLVIKVGGSKGIDLDLFARDLATLHERERIVLVHGANYELDQFMRRVGVEPKLVTSSTGQVSRFTDAETMDLFMAIYCGKMNKRLVEKLQLQGVNAVGLSGLDGRIASGRRKDTIRIVEDGKPKILRGDYAGSIEAIDTRLLTLLLDNGYLPVLTPPAVSDKGEAINVDGDKLAMEIALAMRAEALLIFSNTPGLLRDVADEGSLVPRISMAEIDEGLGMAQGRMKKKVLAAAEAVRGGIGRVVFADARVEAPITRALAGAGTVIA